MAAVTGLNALLQGRLGYQSLALVYLLSVVVLAMFVGRGPTLAAATLTALLWNFLFVPPIFTFRISGATDVMLFFTYFIVALAMGHLAARLRAQQAAERRREQRATALYLLTRELARPPTSRTCWPSSFARWAKPPRPRWPFPCRKKRRTVRSRPISPAPGP